MSVAFTAPELAALEAAHVDLVLFVELQFTSATLYLHSGVGTYTWGGHDWLGIGTLGSISPIEEAEGFSPYELTLQLSGVDQDMIDIALAEYVFENRCLIYLGVLDPADGVTLIATPKQRFAGDMQHVTAVAGKENTITLSVESEFRYFQEMNGSRWTDEQQQSEFSGDQGFEYLPQIQDAKVQWGPGGNPLLFGSPPGGYGNPWGAGDQFGPGGYPGP